MADEETTYEIDDSVAEEAEAAIRTVNEITGGERQGAPKAPPEPSEDAGYGGEEEPAPAAAAAKEEKAPKTPTEAWVERQDKRKSAALQQELDRYKQYADALLQAQLAREREQQPQSTEPQEDPHPNIDPDVKKFMEDLLGRATQPLQQMQQAQVQQQEQEQRFSRAQAARQAIRAQEEEYAQTEVGSGYDDRVEQFRQAFRDEHKEWAKDFPDMRLSDEQLDAAAQQQLEGMAMQALQYGVPIPWAIDRYVRRFIGAASTNGNGTAPPPPRQAPARPASPELAAARRVQEDGMTSVGSSRDLHLDEGEVTVDAVIERGLTAKDVAELAQGGGLADKLARLALQADRALTE